MTVCSLAPRSQWLTAAAVVLVITGTGVTPMAGAESYAWTDRVAAAGDTLATRFPLPAGFQRVAVAPGSFAAWLRGLPLQPEDAPVLLFDGRPKWTQAVHLAVVAIDTGTRDLQQCADAVMRLRAEWLYASEQAAAIGFDYTNGAHVPFSRWAKGERPTAKGSKVHWRRSKKPDRSHAALRAYLDNIFTYAGTYSLAREMDPVPPRAMQIGDVFIQGGFPGHAVLVADMAENAETGERRFLLLQSFMPAQDIHVLRGPVPASPWYPVAFGDELQTPEWTFSSSDLKRWR